MDDLFLTKIKFGSESISVQMFLMKVDMYVQNTDETHAWD